jgi:drug/metabolite transporter (DMT)-like permease
MNHSKTSSLKVMLAIVAVTVFMGGAIVANKIAFREIPPVTFMFFRFALATLVMAVLCIGRYSRLEKKTITRGGLVGLSLIIGNYSFVLGVHGTTASRAGFLTNLAVLFVPLICYLLWRERISIWHAAGIVLAILGLWQLKKGGVAGLSKGDLFSLLCAFSIAIHIICITKMLKGLDVYLLALVQCGIVAIAGGFLSWYLTPSLPAFGTVSLLALVYSALFHTVLTYILQNTFIIHAAPAKVGLMYTLVPIWSMCGGFFLLGERLNAPELTGIILITAGIIAPVLGKFRIRSSSGDHVPEKILNVDMS